MEISSLVKYICLLLPMEENDINTILWEQNPKNPYFDLEIIEIPKINFDPKTPIQIIKNDVEKLKNYFIVAHLNARSLNKNIIELKEIIEKADYFDAFCVSESWLRSRTPKDRFVIQGYNIFRNDRRNRRGGGVCCYVRDNYIAKKIKIPNIPQNPELLFVEVSVLHKKLLLGLSIKPLKSHVGYFMIHLIVWYIFSIDMRNLFCVVILMLISSNQSPLISGCYLTVSLSHLTLLKLLISLPGLQRVLVL